MRVLQRNQKACRRSTRHPKRQKRLPEIFKWVKTPVRDELSKGVKTSVSDKIYKELKISVGDEISRGVDFGPQRNLYIPQILSRFCHQNACPQQFHKFWNSRMYPSNWIFNNFVFLCCRFTFKMKAGDLGVAAGYRCPELSIDTHLIVGSDPPL